jgi:hypothetical protein
MFDVFLTVFMTLVAVAGFFKVLEKKRFEAHLKYALVLSIVAILFAVIAQAEIYIRSAFPIGTTPALPQLVFSFLMPAAWTAWLYWIIAFASALGLYLVGALAGAIVDVVEKYIR